MTGSGDNVEFNLSFTYEDEKREALKSVEGKIPKGKCIVLCGKSGCGKTTLLRCINQLIPKFYEGDLKGFCNIGGKSLDTLSIGETGKLASSVFQDPRSQFFTLNSTHEIAFGLENFGFSNEEIEKRVNAAFEKFNLLHLKDRDVFSLSSGERQLIAILASWAVDTDIMLLDEPTANLDYCAIKNLSTLLEKLKAEGKTLIVSEHRLYYLKNIADEYWFMQDGEIKKKITAEEMLSLSLDERMGMGLRSIDLSSLKNSEKKQIIRSGESFKLENLSFSYSKKGRKILDNLSLEAYGGEVIGLIGHNGCGKTTLGKLIAGLLDGSKGDFYYQDKKIKSSKLHEKSIFIMQEAEFQFFTNSVMGELCCSIKADEGKREEIKELLKKVGLWEVRNKHPFSLSGGQMQRLVLLLAYLSQKPIAVLDEPTAGLDYQSLRGCCEIIKEMQKSKLVFIITHDLELICDVCTRCLSLENGKTARSFDLKSDNEFDELFSYMESDMEKPKRPIPQREKKKNGFDPRVKLFVFALCLIAGIGTHTPLILLTFISSMLIYLFERKFKNLICALFLMTGIYGLYYWVPCVATAFLISFFPRMLIICFGILMLAGKDEATRSIAALRRMHISEKIIMVISVTLRFFPVLQKDLALMGQSIKTRGFFPKFSDKIKAIPQYIEIMIVPMVFRVIRIAEALSASAETRGVALSNKRSSFIKLKMNAKDFIMICLAGILFACGFFI